MDPSDTEGHLCQEVKLRQRQSLRTLREIERNDVTLQTLQIGVSDGEPGTFLHSGYFNRLGKAVGANTHLKTIVFNDMEWSDLGVAHFHNGTTLLGLANVETLLEGIQKNSSITRLVMINNVMNGEVGLDLFDVFSRRNTLKSIALRGCALLSKTESLVRMLQRSTTLEKIIIGPNDRLRYRGHLHSELAVKVISAIEWHHQLTTLSLSLGYFHEDVKAGCNAIGTLLKRTTSLDSLDLRDTGANINDDCACILADGLASNKTLSSLLVSTMNPITNRGWDAFAMALCDTSSINATYSSNHTLTMLGDDDWPSNAPLVRLLRINENGDDAKQIALQKIRQYHRHFDMAPFFEWDARVLPIVMTWWERGAVVPITVENLCCKLDCIYQFIHAMPEVCEHLDVTSNATDPSAKQ